MSGSLRAVSSNTALLEAARLVAPEGVHVVAYDGLATLPHFNPDVEEAAPLPEAVRHLRAEVEQADGLVLCSPEYAHGVPGSLKNALDWLVGGPEFYQKPVALLHASPHSVHAPAILREVIATMSGRLVEGASITLPLRGLRLDAASIAAHPTFAPALRHAVAAFVQAIRDFQHEKAV